MVELGQCKRAVSHATAWGGESLVVSTNGLLIKGWVWPHLLTAIEPMGVTCCAATPFWMGSQVELGEGYATNGHEIRLAKDLAIARSQQLP